MPVRSDARLCLSAIDQEKVAHKLHFKNSKDMLAALGCGDVRMSQILGAIQLQQEVVKKSSETPTQPTFRAPSKVTGAGINIAGVGNLLTHTAQCCKPVPGDAVVGFVTQGRGVAIHRMDCANILHLDPASQSRLFDVDWGHAETNTYPVDIIVDAYDRPGLIRDITTLIANERINLIAMTTLTNKTENSAHITLTIETQGLPSLSKILDRVKQIPNVLAAKRLTSGD